MKKLFSIAIFVLGLGLSSHAVLPNQLGVIYSDIITTADTGTIRADTVYSAWEWMGIGRFLTMAVQAIAITRDTNWVDDSLFFDLQLSYGGSIADLITTIEVDTLLNDSTSIDVVIYDADATVLPPWGRLRVIHWDSIAVGEADSALADSATYVQELKLWYIWR